MNPSELHALPLGAGVRIAAAHDCGLVAVAKPCGVKAHPNEPGRIDPQALLLAPYDPVDEAYVLPAGNRSGGRVWLLNRLDSPTSGLVLLATDQAIAMQVREAFATRRVGKVYHAVVLGVPQNPTAIWRDTLERKAVMESLGHGTPAGRAETEAETHMKVVMAGKGSVPCTLVRLEPKTGRFHQLRLQCARRKLPIAGDATHGDFAINREIKAKLGIDRLCLHASEVHLRLDVRGRTVPLEAKLPLPREFKTMLGVEGDGR